MILRSAGPARKAGSFNGFQDATPVDGLKRFDPGQITAASDRPLSGAAINLPRFALQRAGLLF